jgi:hypothetical protein
MEIMERPRKRKASFSTSNATKRYKDDFSYILNIKILLLQKTIDNEKLTKQIITLEKKMKKVEKYNDDLRTKNLKLENELLEIKDQEKNIICEKLENLEVGKATDYTFSYIN